MFTCWLLVTLAGLAPAAGAPPPLADTAYPVPETAWFVAPTGNDTYSGKPDAPLRTIAAAINRAPASSTIVIRQGVYRESIGSLNKPLILQPYPHEKVWIKGSIEANDWTRDRHGWRLDNWNPRFDRSSYNPGEMAKDYPLAGNPEMAFINGRPLRQVGRLDEHKPGTFFVDNENHSVFIADDPHKSLVELSKFGHALELYRGASGSIIRGLGFAHYANVKHEGAIRALGGTSNVVLENNTFADNAGSSLLIYECRNITLRKNMFLRAGYQGLSAWKTAGLKIEQNEFLANNSEHFATEGDYAGAAAAKIFATTGVTARNNLFAENHCTGLWFDGSCSDCKVICNRFTKNEHAGLHVEESAHAMLVGNEADHNAAAGILISNSSNVRAYNNSLTDNNPNVAIQDDARVNTEAHESDQGITYITADIDLFNNVLAATDSKHQLLWARDFNSVPMKSAADMIRACDFNLWQHPLRQNPQLVEWWQKRVRFYYRDMTDFRADTNFEVHGLERDASLNVPLANAIGQPLPTDIARELNVDPAAPVPMGKLKCPQVQEPK